MTLDQLDHQQRRIIARQEARALRQLARHHGHIPTCAPLGASGIGRGELRTDVAEVADAVERRNERRIA